MFLERGIIMNTVYRYLFCVICTVVLCGIIRILFSGYHHSIMKLVTGLVVTVVMFSPILGNSGYLLNINFSQYLEESDFSVQDGIDAARQASNEYIKSKSETYILNKAEEMGAHVSVDVVLSDSELPVPAQITLCGAVSPYIRQQLVDCIQNELGIAEDEQIWIS